MNIYEVDDFLMDLMAKYEDGDATSGEILFLKNLHDDLIDMFGEEKFS